MSTPHRASADHDTSPGRSPRQCERTRATPAPAPGALATHLLHLQRTAGNAAVNELLRRHAPRRRQVVLQRDAEQGTEADAAIGPRISAQRGRGRPLDTGVQSTLETGLGADLSAVRVHTDGEADHLSRSVQAVAFTTGADIFFRSGAYNPATPRGLHLLAHEATHTMQQAQGPVAGTPHPGGVSISHPSDRFEQAADATAARVMAGQTAIPAQRTAAGGSTPLPLPRDEAADIAIQRAVGFEFETPWDTYEAVGALTRAQKEGKQAIPLGLLRPLAKKDVIVGNEGFELQADERAQAAQGSDMEFVTRPFGEQERGALEKTMNRIEKMCAKLISHPHTYIEGKSLKSYGRPGPKNAVIKRGSSITGEPQATGGIRLDQIADLMRNVGGAQPGEDNATRQARGPGRTILMGMSIPDRNLVGQAPGMADAGLQRYRTAKAGTADDAPAFLGSSKLRSLLALTITYLVKGNGLLGDYAKTIAPLMARTDFAALFRLLPDEEKTYLCAADATGPTRWTVLALEAAGLPGSANTPVFAGGLDLHETDPLGNAIIDHSLDPLTRGRWLDEMTRGVDLLTENSAPIRRKLVEKTGVLALGSYGTRTDRVGAGAFSTDAPIFEFRRMSKGVAYDMWAGIALDLFDYLKAVNAGPASWAVPSPRMGSTAMDAANNRAIARQARRRGH